MEVSRVKFCLGRTVGYNDGDFIFTACIMRQGKDGFYFQAELADPKAKSSLVITDLEKVIEK